MEPSGWAQRHSDGWTEGEPRLPAPSLLWGLVGGTYPSTDAQVGSSFWTCVHPLKAVRYREAIGPVLLLLLCGTGRAISVSEPQFLYSFNEHNDGHSEDR